jgi:hypothetical protein
MMNPPILRTLSTGDPCRRVPTAPESVLRTWKPFFSPTALIAATALLLQTALATFGQPITDHYIAVFKPGLPDVAAAAAEAANPLGLQVSGVYEHSIQGFAFRGNAQAAQALTRNPRIAYVEQDQLCSIQSLPEIPTGVRRSGVDEAILEAISPNRQPVLANIAILDSGLQRDHPDLNVDPDGIRFFTTTTTTKGKTQTVLASDENWDDEHGHGTHVGGIAGANGQIVGVAPGARLTAVKVLDSNNSGSWSVIIAGIDWVAAPERAGRFDVANMSLGGGFSQAVNDAVNSASAKGIVFVVAAGNRGSDAGEMSPASAESAITVSAMLDYDGAPGGMAHPDPTVSGCKDSSGAVVQPHRDDGLACWSNFGRVVDVCAPGGPIKSTGLNSGYHVRAGTSMSAPHVAGAAALFIALNREDLTALTGMARVNRVTHAITSTGWIQGQWGYFSDDKDEFPEPLLNVRSMLWQPTVTILEPENGYASAVGEQITFNAEARLGEDDWTPHISWSSSIIGPIESGGQVSATLPEGIHTIVASITDAYNTISGSDSITITVGQPPLPPQLFVSLSTDKPVYKNGETMRAIHVVTDQNGLPVAGATIKGVVTTFNGKIYNGSGTTDSAGRLVMTLKINVRDMGSGSCTIKSTASMTGYPSASAETSFIVQ